MIEGDQPDVGIELLLEEALEAITSRLVAPSLSSLILEIVQFPWGENE